MGSRERGPDPARFDAQPTADVLWQRAASVLANGKNGLADTLPRAPGFGSGARWMERVLRVVRRERASAPGRFAETGGVLTVLAWVLGLGKYGGALLAGFLASDVVFTWSANAGLEPNGWNRALVTLALVPTIFYAIEVWLVFAFPAALDGEQPVSESARLVSRRGALRNLRVLLGIARRMVLVAPARLRRSWATGCVAVVIWYEYERAAARSAGERSDGS